MGPVRRKANQVQQLLGLTQIQIQQQIENCHAHNSSISGIPGLSRAEHWRLCLIFKNKNNNGY